MKIICGLSSLLLALPLMPNPSMAASVIHGELEVADVGGFVYGPDPGFLIVDLTDLPSETLAQKFVKIANDLDASSDPTSAMPQFQVEVQRDLDNNPATITWSTFTTNELSTEFTDVAAGLYNIRLEPDPATDGDFAAEKIYTLTITAANGGWAVDQPNNAHERVRVGIRQSSGSTRLYFAASGGTEAEAEVPFIKLVSDDPVDFGEVIAGRPKNDQDEEIVNLANVGTGVLNIESVGDPINQAFEGPAIFGTVTVDPLERAPDLKISLNPAHPDFAPTQLGVVTTTMPIGSNSHGNPTLDINLQATAVQLELGLLLDISGSMGFTPAGSTTSDHTETRIFQAKQGGSNIIDIFSGFEGDVPRVGLFTYPQFGAPTGASAETLQSLAPLSSAKGRLDDAWANTGSGSLQPHNNTPMAEGLHEAHGIGTGSDGPFTRPDPWTEGRYVRRALILLADGDHNENSSQPPINDSDWVTQLELITDPDKKIKVFTVAYGEEKGRQVDWDTMKKLAEAGGGLAYQAEAETYTSLKSKLRQALVDWRDWSTVADPAGTLTKGGPAQVHEVCIDDSLDRIAFNVDYDKAAETAINFQLVGPNGLISASSPDVTFHQGQNYSLYIVKGATAKGNPGSDKWQIRLAGGSALSSNESLDYEYSAIGKAKTKLNSNLADFDFTTLAEGYLVEVDLIGRHWVLADDITATVKYDLPAQSRGTYVASMEGFDKRWLLTEEQRRWLLKKADTGLPLIPAAYAQERPDDDVRMVPVTILGEPANLLQRKAYALANFADRPFRNLRATEQIDLVDDGTNGDKIAGDGVYSAMLSELPYDGLAHFGVFVAGGDDDDCITREWRVDKVIGVGIDPEILAENVVVADAVPDILFPPDLQEILSQPPPSRMVRRSVVVTPQDARGNLLGPGQVGQLTFALREAESIGPVVDNADGSYTKVIQYAEGADPQVQVAVGEVSTEPIDVTEDKKKFLPWLIGVGVAILIAVLIAL